MREELTEGRIYNLNEISRNSYFGKYISRYKDLKQFKYILVIQSTSSKCMKLSIYPLKIKDVTKLILYGEKGATSKKHISEMEVSHIIKLLNKFKIIHTSGLLMNKGRPLFECYLNKDLSKTNNSIIQNITRFVKTLNLNLKIEKIK
jgi:hypothetical protein